MNKLRIVAYLFSVVLTFFGGAAARDWYVVFSSASVATSEGNSVDSNLESTCAPVQITSCSPPTNVEAYDFATAEIERAHDETDEKEALLDAATSRIEVLEDDLAALEVDLKKARQELVVSEAAKVDPIDVDTDHLNRELQRERLARNSLEVEFEALTTELFVSEQKATACSEKVSLLEDAVKNTGTQVSECSGEVETGKGKIVELESQLSACNARSESKQTSTADCSRLPNSDVNDGRWIQKFLENSKWVGAVTQPNSSRPYRMILRIEDDQLIVDYPELSCGGIWELQSDIDSNQWKFDERLTYDDQSRCVNRGDVILEMTNSGVLRYQWFAPGRKSVVAWADLLPSPN
jgi:phage shock protein A